MQAIFQFHIFTIAVVEGKDGALLKSTPAVLFSRQAETIALRFSQSLAHFSNLEEICSCISQIECLSADSAYTCLALLMFVVTQFVAAKRREFVDFVFANEGVAEISETLYSLFSCSSY